MNAATPGQADPWQVITDIMSELIRGGQTAGIRCRGALGVLERAGISFSGDAYEAAQQAREFAAQERPAPGDASVPVDRAIKEWLDRRTATALATAPGIDEREQGKRQGIDDLRQRLDDYWYTLTPAVLAALGGEPQAAPELAAVEAKLRETAADNIRLRDTVRKLHALFGNPDAHGVVHAVTTRARLERLTGEAEDGETDSTERDRLRDWLDEATRIMLNLGTRPAEVQRAREIRDEAGLS